jgi:hypothetical protein
MEYYYHPNLKEIEFDVPEELVFDNLLEVLADSVYSKR